MQTISFKISRADAALLGEVVDRAMRDLKHLDRMMLHMDLTATHANGCPLDLAFMLTVDNFTFAHDVYGITRHIDRNTGKLMDCFVPRCAARVAR